MKSILLCFSFLCVYSFGFSQTFENYTNLRENINNDANRRWAQTQAIDYDNDGNIDILAFDSRNDEIVLFKNVGNNTWENGEVVLSNFNQSQELSSFLAHDFEHDGRVDIILMYFDEGSVYHAYQYPDGEFKEARRIAFGVEWVSQARVADLNEDGFDDLVVSGRKEGHINVFLHDGENMITLKSTQQFINRISSINDILIEDIDADGKLELLVAGTYSETDLNIYEYDTDTNLFEIESDDKSTALSPHLCFADLNGDSYKDIVNTGGRYIYYFAAHADGTFDTEKTIWLNTNRTTINDIRYAENVDGDGLNGLFIKNDYHEIIFYEMDPSSGEAIGRYVYQTDIRGNSDFDLADIDKDGKLDVIYADQMSDVAVLPTFENLTEADYGPNVSVLDIENLADALVETVFTDLNNDGLMDIIGIRSGQLGYAFSEGEGKFGRFEVIYSANWIRELNLQDVNKDGIKDLVFLDLSLDGIQFIPNFENGNFGAAQNAFTDVKKPKGLLAYDFTGNRELDYLVFSEDEKKISLIVDNGLTISSLTNDKFTNNYDKFTAIDWNKGGFKEAYLGFWQFGSPLILNIDEEYNLSISELDYGTNNINFSKVVDMNEDGYDDLVTASFIYYDISVLENNQNGNVDQAGYKPLYRTVDDVFEFEFIQNPDTENQDMVMLNDNGIIYIKGDADYSFTSTPIYLMNNLNAARDLRLVDIDGDTDLDILFSDSYTNKNYWIKNKQYTSTSIDEEPNRNQQANTVELLSNYPNPFNPTTTIQYQLNKASEVQISIYDMNGRLLRSINQGVQPSGTQTYHFDASHLSTGVYLYKVQADQHLLTGKMTLIK